MKRSEKQAIIDNLVQEINSYNHFYLADIADLDSEKTSELRRTCFQKDVKLIVVKNTLLKRALEASEKNTEELFESLKGNTSLMFCDTGNVPAKLIKEFRKKNKKLEKPVFKAAYVEEAIYVGEDQLEILVNVKSKEELIGDVISLLQSPAKNVISALQSSGQTISGILTTLSEKE
ncbi:MAG: 50S ribosomal protein L10 [Prolixibacteraceae bacterium]|jgi:large subunit ribosomal protein L10|nr:50S ribosomal protein L10 [Prolixibacteraceae bacterium]